MLIMEQKIAGCFAIEKAFYNVFLFHGEASLLAFWQQEDSFIDFCIFVIS